MLKSGWKKTDQKKLCYELFFIKKIKLQHKINKFVFIFFALKSRRTVFYDAFCKKKIFYE